MSDKLRQWLHRLIPLVIVAGLASLPFAFAEGTTRFWQGVMIQIFVFAIYAMSYDLLLGYTGIISFGHALFFGVGGYTTAVLLNRPAPPSFVMVVVAVIAGGALVGLLVGLLLTRLNGVAFSMITLALAEVAFILFKSDDPKLKPLTGGELGLQGLTVPAAIDPFSQRLRFYFLALTAMIGLYLLTRRIVNSPTGRVLVAVRENEPRAITLGYNTLRYKIFGVMLSAMLAAFAGMLLVLYDKSASYELFSVNMTMQALLMTIIGGIGTLIGPMIGAGSVRLLDYWLKSESVRQFLPPWLRADLVFGLVYIALVLFFPRGLAGAFERLRKKPSRTTLAAVKQSLKV